VLNGLDHLESSMERQQLCVVFAHCAAPAGQIIARSFSGLTRNTALDHENEIVPMKSKNNLESGVVPIIVYRIDTRNLRRFVLAIKDPDLLQNVWCSNNEHEK
jgi:hypothetical protein